MLCLCGLSEISNEGYFKKMHRVQCFACGCCCVIPGGPLESSLTFTKVVFSLKALFKAHKMCHFALLLWVNAGNFHVQTNDVA